MAIRAGIKTEDQYDALSKRRALRAANSANAAPNGGKASGSGGDCSLVGIPAEDNAVGGLTDV